MHSKNNKALNTFARIDYSNLLMCILKNNFPTEPKHAIETVTLSYLEVRHAGSSNKMKFELDACQHSSCQKLAIVWLTKLRQSYKNIFIDELILNFQFEALNPYATSSFPLKLILPEGIVFADTFQDLGLEYLYKWNILRAC